MIDQPISQERFSSSGTDGRERISIIIATRNRSGYLSKLLTRTVWQFGHDIASGVAEILVFDDASTDATPEVCRQMRPWIKSIRADERVGYIEARRRMMGQASGAYLVSLDDDSAFVDANALDIVRDTFRAAPRCAVLAANVALPKRPAGQVPISDPPTRVHTFTGCGHAFRAEVVRELGGYPAFLSGYGGEEAIISVRVLDSGRDILLIPRLRVFHQVSASGRDVGAQRAAQLTNAMGVVVAAYPAWLVLPSVLAKLLTYSWYGARHGTGRSLVRGALRIPAALWVARRYRTPVGTGTIWRHRQLRSRFERRSDSWLASTAAVAQPWFLSEDPLGESESPLIHAPLASL